MIVMQDTDSPPMGMVRGEARTMTTMMTPTGGGQDQALWTVSLYRVFID